MQARFCTKTIFAVAHTYTGGQCQQKRKVFNPAVYDHITWYNIDHYNNYNVYVDPPATCNASLKVTVKHYIGNTEQTNVGFRAFNGSGPAVFYQNNVFNIGPWEEHYTEVIMEDVVCDRIQILVPGGSFSRVCWVPAEFIATWIN